MLGLKTVFAIVPSARSAELAIRTFKALPVGQRTRLIGVHVSPTPVSYGLASDLALSSLIAAQIEAAEAARTSSERAFADSCMREGIPYEWRTSRTSDYLIGQQAGALARSGDLLIYPKPSTEDGEALPPAEEIVFSAGRPVLLVPSDWKMTALGKRVIIAWDGGRESTRAVFDALPILLNATVVRIVSVEGYLDEPVRQFTPGDDLAAALSRHGIKTESHAFRGRGGNVRAELETAFLDAGADLVVMGCYGHSRFREMILGGVSQSMLKDVPFPLLLSS